MVIKLMLMAALLPAFASASCCMTDSSIDFESTPVSTMGEGAGATTDGETTWWIVRRAAVAKTPDWSSREEPPLSLAKAVQLAELEMPKYTKTPDAYRLDGVDFVSMGNPHINEPRKWFYVVTLEREYVHGGQRFDAAH